MKKTKTIYTDAPPDVEQSLDHILNNPIPTDDTLPSPEYFKNLLAKEKISLNIDRSTVESFRAYSKKHGLKYQSLINQVLRSYAGRLK